MLKVKVIAAIALSSLFFNYDPQIKANDKWVDCKSDGQVLYQSTNRTICRNIYPVWNQGEGGVKALDELILYNRSGKSLIIIFLIILPYREKVVFIGDGKHECAFSLRGREFSEWLFSPSPQLLADNSKDVRFLLDTWEGNSKNQIF
ncbi:hypothetical protein PCC6912_40090 [Chlorogloeopsis fritschii PCC 6912]|uniref:Uncharacterized protein n=2 Tax=Chlorogloeopsis fritschii TaxID=1124 RepID=A0A3S0ZJ09_CHLFR|nr:hypothetical protein [Chlorogloeopsis fritschii]RUR77050.1 hypothetical protein PCC6912_40090 [Chlorogloeopsis fritschii PCC 6912]